MSRIKTEQFDNKLRALQDDINSLSQKLSISPRKSKSKVESTIIKPNQDRVNVEESNHFTSHLKRRQDYSSNNELQKLIIQRDEAIKKIEIIKGENLQLQNSVEELKSIRELYEHLKRDYESLKLSMESSERIRRQQKELIYMLQQSAVIKQDFIHESASAKPTHSNIKPTTVFHDFIPYESDRKEKLASKTDNLTTTNTATILGDSSRHKIINDINDTLPIDFNKTIRINSEYYPSQTNHTTTNSNNISLLPDNGYHSHRLYDNRDNSSSNNNNMTRTDNTVPSPQTMQEMYKTIRNTYIIDNQGNDDKINMDQDVDDASSIFLDRHRSEEAYNKNRTKYDPVSTIQSNSDIQARHPKDNHNNLKYYYQEEYPKTARSELSSTSMRDKSLLSNRRDNNDNNNNFTQTQQTSPRKNSQLSKVVTTSSTSILSSSNNIMKPPRESGQKHTPNLQILASSRKRSTSRPRSAPASRSRTPSKHYMNPISSMATSTNASGNNKSK